MSNKGLDVNISSLYNHKYLVHQIFCVFFTFLTILSNLDVFGVIGSDFCHSHSRYAFSCHRC